MILLKFEKEQMIMALKNKENEERIVADENELDSAIAEAENAEDVFSRTHKRKPVFKRFSLP